jgi:hypothetical protein
MAKHLIIFLKNTLCQHNQYIQEFESQNWMYIIPIIWNNSNWQWNSIALASFLEGLLVDKFRGRLFLQFKLIFMICFQFFFMFMDQFWCADIKYDFQKMKKKWFSCISERKTLWKAISTTLPNTISEVLLCPITYLSHMNTAFGVVVAKAFVGEVCYYISVLYI